MSRRGFLRAAAVGAATAPWLRPFTTRAEPGELPRRFVVFFTPNGTIPEEWSPDGGEHDFSLRTILEPLARHRDDLLILEGVDMKSASSGPGDGHQKGMGHLLTGVDLLPGDTMGGCDSCAPVSWSGGISVDQEIASLIGASTPFRSLELGVRVGGSHNVWTRMCYRGASQPLPPEGDPHAVFERLFGDLGADPFGLERRRFMRRSVLDHVRRDFASIEARVSAADRERLELHVSVLRDIERRIESSGGLGAACAAPTMGGRVDPDDPANVPQVGRLQMDLLAMAFACDLTRVGTLQWTTAVGNIPFPFLGIEDRHHDLSHEGDGNGSARDKLVQINRWYAEQLAYLIDRLKAIPEGEGTVFDNTCILWGNELGKGNSHTRDGIPFVMAGSAGGHFRTGRYLRFDRASHCDLLTSLAQAYGVEADRFGDVRFSNGPLPGLV